MAKISVIVAVYKMPEYLPRCIEGILNQTHRDLELILVDDGSPDQCGDICDAYAGKDSRVRVLHKENEGVCIARNTALDWVFANSTSDYIFFHDNDDWIHPQTLERMLKASQDLQTEIAICGYQLTKGEDPVIGEKQLEPQLWKAEEFYQQHLVNATVCWGKLYRRSCFEGKRYPPGRFLEDEYLTYRLLLEAEKLAIIEAPLYAYFVNPNGITKSTWRPKRLDAWEAFEQQLVYFRDFGYPELVTFRLREYLDNALVNLEGAESVCDGKSVRFIKKRIRDLLRRCWHAGCIEFQYDYDLLVRFYPLTTKLYRFYLEKIRH